MSESETSDCSLLSLHGDDQENDKTPFEACTVLPGRGLILVDDMCAMSPIALRQDDSFETHAVCMGLMGQDEAMMDEDETAAGEVHVKSDCDDSTPSCTEQTLINTEQSAGLHTLQCSGSHSSLDVVPLNHQHDLVPMGNQQLEGQSSSSRDDRAHMESTEPKLVECENEEVKEEVCTVATYGKALMSVEHQLFQSGPSKAIEGTGSDPMLSGKVLTGANTFPEPTPYHAMELNSVNEENEEMCTVATNAIAFMSLEVTAFSSDPTEEMDQPGS